MESIYEAFFFLKYSGGWSFSEAYNLPIGLRTWFIKRLITQIEKEHEAIEKAQSGNGSSQTQTLTPYNQPDTPSMLSKK
jgi:hypothetical protein|tara:strand:- start:1787 stop:2023 length:237 start_codon:yes stop_codon:yes gene_type:complete